MSNWRRQAWPTVVTVAMGLATITSALTQGPSQPGGSPSPVPPSSAGGRVGPASDVDPRPYDPFVFQTLDECRKQVAGVTYQGSELRGYGVNHFQWCAWSAVRLLKVDTKGNRDGELQFRLTALARASEDARRIETVLYIDKVHWRYIVPFNGGNTSIKFAPSCTLDNRGGTCSFAPDVPARTLNAVSSNPVAIGMASSQTLNPATNPLAIMQGFMTFTHSYTTTAPGRLIVGTLRLGQLVRCDSAHVEQTGYRTPACIFLDAAPVLNLNRNNVNIDESALHIRNAQQNPATTKPSPPGGQPKTIPSVLTRHWDQVLNADQRTKSVAACREAYGPRPANKDCDEFPFASTYEGSLATPPAGQDENYNYSVLYIDSSDNRRVGSWLGKWYVKDRILQGDTFRVNIFDGPVYPIEEPVEDPPARKPR